MSKYSPTKKTHWLIKLFYPHQANNHHPHAIRHGALALYLIALLAFNISYNALVLRSNQVLGFATAISQPQLIYLTNQTRLANGVAALNESPLLDESARLKAQNMFAEDYWAHFSPSGKSPWVWFDQAGYVYSLAGENLARDFSTSQGVIDGWMNSPSHRANMLAAGYKDIGIAVMNGTLQGHETTLVVQHFGTPVVTAATPGTTAGAVTPPAPSPTTNTPVQEQTINQQNVLPTMAEAGGIPSSTFSKLQQIPYQLLHPQPLASWGVPQTVTVVFLAILMLLFLFDSSVIWRKNLPRTHSHSLLHAGAMAVLIILVAYSATGGIL